MATPDLTPHFEDEQLRNIEFIKSLKPFPTAYDPIEAQMQSPELKVPVSDDSTYESSEFGDILGIPETPTPQETSYPEGEKFSRLSLKIPKSSNSSTFDRIDRTNIDLKLHETISYTINGVRWFDISLGLWLYQRIPLDDSKPPSPVLFFSQRSGTWLCLPAYESLQAIENFTILQSSKKIQSSPPQKSSPNDLSHKEIVTQDMESTLKLAKLQRIEKIDVINKLIAEKESEILKKTLDRQNLNYFSDGLAFKTQNKQQQGEGRGDHKHIWCRQGAPGSDQGFRPVHFYPSPSLNDRMEKEDQPSHHFETKESTPNYLTKNKKSFLHGKYSYYPNSQYQEDVKSTFRNHERDSSSDKQHERTGTIIHSRDFEWIGRPVTVESKFHF